MSYRLRVWNKIWFDVCFRLLNIIINLKYNHSVTMLSFALVSDEPYIIIILSESINIFDSNIWLQLSMFTPRFCASCLRHAMARSFQLSWRSSINKSTSPVLVARLFMSTTHPLFPSQEISQFQALPVIAYPGSGLVSQTIIFTC